MSRIFFVFALLLAELSFAGVMFDLDYASFQDTITTSSQSGGSKSLYNAGLMVNVDSKERFYLGATFLGASSSNQQSGSTETFSTQDVILGFRWELNKNKLISVSGGYGVVARAAYSAGSTSETWTGTSYVGKLSIQPTWGRRLNIGFSLVYYQGNFTNKVASNASTSVSYTKSILFPTLGMTWRW